MCLCRGSMLYGMSMTIYDLKIVHRCVEEPLKVGLLSLLCPEARPQHRITLAWRCFIFCQNGTQAQSGQSQGWGRLTSVGQSLPQALRYSLHDPPTHTHTDTCCRAGSGGIQTSIPKGAALLHPALTHSVVSQLGLAVPVRLFML